MAIAWADIKTILLARHAEKKLAQLTNQYLDEDSSDAINDAIGTGAANDANLFFEVLAANSATMTIAEDKIALHFLTMFFLYFYAENQGRADLYLAFAKIACTKAFDAHMRSRFPEWNEDKYTQELTIRQYYVNMLPEAPIWQGYASST